MLEPPFRLEKFGYEERPGSSARRSIRWFVESRIERSPLTLALTDWIPPFQLLTYGLVGRAVKKKEEKRNGFPR
jgi:hypothetical protein